MYILLEEGLLGSIGIYWDWGGFLVAQSQPNLNSYKDYNWDPNPKGKPAFCSLKLPPWSFSPVARQQQN